MMINSHDDYLLTRTLCKDLATFLRLILSFWLCAFVALLLLLASTIHFTITITTTALLTNLQTRWRVSPPSSPPPTTHTLVTETFGGKRTRTWVIKLVAVRSLYLATNH